MQAELGKNNYACILCLIIFELTKTKIIMKKILLLSDTHSHMDDQILKHVKYADTDFI
mgnify:CR=1 FL=1